MAYVGSGSFLVSNSSFKTAYEYLCNITHSALTDAYYKDADKIKLLSGKCIFHNQVRANSY